MTVLCVIPVRWASTRFPGKALAPVAGKPMVQHVWERTRAARLVDEVVVATDDERIRRAVESFGGRALMTPAECPSGTDRAAEAVRLLLASEGLSAEVVVNVQGDEPLVRPEMVEGVIRPLLAEPDLPMATLTTPIREEAEWRDPNVVKVVADERGRALYFSRSPLPYYRGGGGDFARLRPRPLRHIGLYAYRREFLLELAALPPGSLEGAEGLEQLRALERGHPIRVVETPRPALGVDLPEDLRRLEATPWAMEELRGWRNTSS
ncbi:MAG: 3-deoxy-manno-octulosonate cytidylyltransferase [Nitrospinota bacterium]